MDSCFVPLERAEDEAVFGGKSVNLGRMLRSGLPVPGGWALSWSFARAVSRGERRAVDQLIRLGDENSGLLAVRSSAVGEDAAGASFAGQHVTVLGVKGAHALVSAVLRVERSGEAASAQSYRQLTGNDEPARVAVVIQHLLDPEVAGVMFTRNPMTGEDERLIEAAWGLGEAVVASKVTPDSYRIHRGGELIAAQPGQKTVSLHPVAGGGLEERKLSDERASSLTLTRGDLEELHRLATACERAFGGPQDIEWAKADGSLWVLQSRPISGLARTNVVGEQENGCKRGG